jgi:hypothetical protein
MKRQTLQKRLANRSREAPPRCVECTATTTDGIGWHAYVTVGHEDEECAHVLDEGVPRAVRLARAVVLPAAAAVVVASAASAMTAGD